MKPLLLNSILFSAVLSAAPPSQPPSFHQGDVLPNKQYPAAYNAPAQVKLQDNEGKWLTDLFIDASFLYYHADEGGLDLANSAALVSVGNDLSVAATSNSRVAFQKFEYKPGFKVGIGGRWCEWSFAGEYTWIRQTTKKSQAAPNTNLPGGSPVWILNDWFQQISPAGQSISATALNSTWHLSMDLADLMASRAFYEGRNLIITPSFGVRGAWIRQNLRVGINLPANLFTNQISGEVFSRNSSNSWAVGPRAALEADCLLGMGFRLQGDAAASLLFTQYTHVKHRENAASTTSALSMLKTRYTNYNCLRPVGEVGLGIGWGSYCQGQKYHVDLSASYDFMIFWDQNMIRALMDSTVEGVGAAAGNLNLHGLTLAARFDF